ncbi:MAG: DUF6353 family protein [Paenisporosarcina sp.]
MLSTSKVMKYVPNSVIRTVSRQVLIAKKNSPHIFFGVGLAGTILGTVLACRATLKLSETLDDIQKDLDAVNKKNRIPPQGDLFANEVVQRDAVQVYVKSGLKIVKLYGPSIVVSSASIALLTNSHVNLARRNTALMAAYATVQKAYEDYRERVREIVGEEKELELYRGIETKTIKGEDGTEIEIKTVDPNKHSVYAKFFDEYSEFWNKDPEFNRIYVQAQQNYANNLLHARGHVFLNEVYDMLGIERSSAGQVVGWLRHSDGDNYVSFGIFEAFNSAFVNGTERSILLDFNVDGVIWDKI